MSKQVKHYYECDYCKTEIDYSNKSKAYTDNSGYRSKTFDMCCEDCLNEHLEHIKYEITKGNIKETVEEYKEKYIKTFWT